ncbi:PREDICTED: coiled-coil domain-containing protein 148-like [Branchiostoma belcheri]|uniref:Coiled-coil domain-containing protein 148-like n=1 Tax=Branchiostoma belcheri TaxID=7741 RepID=A0A6P4ZW69_BRABE|nr:PREDICTED: coiled-coil domain-containing protein 148-like [Branchiostoma belcheri]
MSGRDLKNFLFLHRSDPTDKGQVFTRIMGGNRSNKYRQVDYDAVRELIADRRRAGEEKLGKVQQIAQKSKAGKEHNLQKQHKMVWHKEQLRLTTARRQAQIELDGLTSPLTHDFSLCTEFFDECEAYNAMLSADTGDFKAATVDPVWDLREDLLYWLQEHAEAISQGEGEDLKEEHQEIKDQVESVKAQQQDLMQRLQQEQRKLEDELNLPYLQNMLHAGDKLQETGIPPAVASLECPDRKLKDSVLQEFLHIDSQYQERLEELEHTNKETISSSTGGWKTEDHWVFQVVLEQYPHDLPHRRQLYLDRLRKHLPRKTRAALVSHEAWYSAYRLYHDQIRSVRHSWTRDRAELMGKARATFAAVCTAHEQAREARIKHQEQEDICAVLREQLHYWQEIKREQMAIEAAIKARMREEEEERRQMEEKKEKLRRAKDHQRLVEFYEEKQRARAVAAEADRRRMEELQKLMAEQAEHDKERVKYREEQIEKKHQRRKEAQERQEEEEREKERRLEALRQMVEPHVEVDPVRMMGDTTASKARMGIGTEEDINIQRPLFHLHGFTDQQVASDNRVRVEQALREAGLHTSEYARHILKDIAPPRPPRKDQESSVHRLLDHN